jgi:hypothetical protein
MDPLASTGVCGLSAQVAEEAVAGAVGRLCRGGSWQGIARELGWRAVTAGGRDLGSLEALCAVAEARLALMIDDAVWAAEQCALRGWQEYLQVCPGEEEGAVAAARLDANEEATRLIAAAYADVLESLVVEGNIARPARRGLRLRRCSDRAREALAA